MKAIIFIISIFAVIGLFSCKSTRYVPVESVKYDSVYLTKLVRDSVYIKDSVLILKGDTIREYRYKYIYKYQDRVDTIYINKTDSIKVPYPVEAKLTKWQTFKQNIGGFAIIAFISMFLSVVVYFIYKIKNS